MLKLMTLSLELLNCFWLLFVGVCLEKGSSLSFNPLGEGMKSYGSFLKMYVSV